MNVFNKIKNWKPSVGARFAFAFWTGWAFHMGSDTVAKLLLAPDWSWITLSIVVILSFIPIVIYSRNKIKFEREFIWMSLKNPEKKDPWDV